MSNGGRRPGMGGWSWLVLALSAVIAAVAAAAAKLAGAPDWLVLSAAAAGAAVPAVATAVRTQLEHSRKADAEQRKLTAGAAGRDRLVRDYSSAELRVHNAIRQDVPYVVRDVEPEIVKRIRWERRVLIVGPSMAGKTRLALSAAKATVGEFVLYAPADGKSIHDDLAAGTQFSNVVVWLDDLERYLGASGLSAADRTTLYESRSVAVVATTGPASTTSCNRVATSNRPVGMSRAGSVIRYG